VESEFRDLTLWHHDFPPPLDHCFHQVEEWGKLAQAVRVFVRGEGRRRGGRLTWGSDGKGRKGMMRCTWLLLYGLLSYNSLSFCHMHNRFTRTRTERGEREVVKSGG